MHVCRARVGLLGRVKSLDAGCYVCAHMHFKGLCRLGFLNHQSGYLSLRWCRNPTGKNIGCRQSAHALQLWLLSEWEVCGCSVLWVQTPLRLWLLSELKRVIDSNCCTVLMFW
jgi:hypothetical protein